MGKKKAEIVVPAGRLWPDTPSGAPLNIEVFGATGEYDSGKTLLGLSIAPGVHPEGHKFAGKPRTLYLDFEKSGGTYGGTGCERKDVPAILMNRQINYTPLRVFEWFSGLVDNVEPGQFDVIMADPVTDIEGGLVEYVKANCQDFGLTRNQIDKGGGLLWGAVKDYWKQVLLKLSTRCQCFYFTSHMRTVWHGNTPTNRREPKGKDTLMELASLYLQLEREPDKEGRVAAAPSAIVLKERLADTVMTEDGKLDIIQLLPPRIPAATVGEIRRYISAPPDYSKLKVGERIIEKAPTEEEMERLRLARAEAERETNASRLELLKRKGELDAAAAQAQRDPPPQSDQTAQRQAERAARAKAETDKLEREAVEAERRLAAADKEGKRLMATSPQAVGGATRAQVQEVRELVTNLKITPEKLKEILAKVNVTKVSDLSREHCLLLIEKLSAQWRKVSPVPF